MDLNDWIKSPLPITVEYCQSKMDELRERMSQRTKEIEEEGWTGTVLNDCGFIYIMEFPDNLFKIGRSKDPMTREKQLQQSSHVPCRLIHVFATNNIKEAENEIKDRLTKEIGWPDHGMEYWYVSEDEIGELPWFGGQLWTQY